MNMKQKLTYMLIGCLFTLAGFVLSSLFYAPTQAQDENVTVFDKIVCKKLEIVNNEGITVAELKSLLGLGFMSINNAMGESLVCIRSEVLGETGTIEILNADGKRLVYIGELLGLGFMSINNADEKRLVHIGLLTGSGYMSISNVDEKAIVNIGLVDGGKIGRMEIFNAAEKRIVDIGSGRDGKSGLVNIYNNSGSWRSFSAEGVSRLK